MDRDEQARALTLLRMALDCINDELNFMDEEERKQPIPAAHGRVADKIEKFLKAMRAEGEGKDR